MVPKCPKMFWKHASESSDIGLSNAHRIRCLRQVLVDIVKGKVKKSIFDFLNADLCQTYRRILTFHSTSDDRRKVRNASKMSWKGALASWDIAFTFALWMKCVRWVEVLQKKFIRIFFVISSESLYLQISTFICFFFYIRQKKRQKSIFSKFFKLSEDGS